MAYTSRTLAAPCDVVWQVIADPRTYPDWLIGAADVRDIDEAWPNVGTCFRHRVGLGRLAIPDHTEVLEVEAGRLLRLGVRARPLISAVATFELLHDPTGTVVTLEEEPRQRLIGNLVRPVMDPAIHVRNHRSLRRLDLVVRRRIAAGQALDRTA
jgi:uncharacterized protein YndB with AHSA1/START domain